jgi:hypothetical protein
MPKEISKKMRLVDVEGAIIKNNAYTKGISATDSGSAMYV